MCHDANVIRIDTEFIGFYQVWKEFVAVYDKVP